MDDVRTVMDAVGCERAALFGVSEGGAMSMLLAATYPERTGALVLDGADGHTPSWMLPPDKFDLFVGLIDRSWAPARACRPSPPARPQTRASAAGGRASSASAQAPPPRSP